MCSLVPVPRSLIGGTRNVSHIWGGATVLFPRHASVFYYFRGNFFHHVSFAAWSLLPTRLLAGLGGYQGHHCFRAAAPLFAVMPQSSMVCRHYDPRRFRARAEQVTYADPATAAHADSDSWGPLDEYDKRVHSGQLRDDEHQRSIPNPLSLANCIGMLIHSWGGPGIVQSLQDLHDMLKEYHPAALVHPRNEPRTRISRWSLGFLFGPRSPKKTPSIPPNLPKGLYMYGDVGSGKTMLMDLFYDTLPANIQSRTRIHFHNFMQDVHKRLHAMKAELGNDLDAIKYVAADIAEKGRVLCFDEFQCTDVADAMILRRFVRPNP